MINILIGEEHKLLREGIIALLKNEIDIKIIDDVGSAKEVINSLRTHPNVDILLMGMNGKDMNGMKVINYAQIHNKAVCTIIISDSLKDESLYELVGAGAKGLLLKTCSNDELLFAIRKISKLGIHFSSEVLMGILNKNIKNYFTYFKGQLHFVISKKESEVLQLISDGLTNIEIGHKLFSSKRTIETHRLNILNKTQSKNTAQLIKFAVKHNLVN